MHLKLPALAVVVSRPPLTFSARIGGGKPPSASVQLFR